MINKFSLTGEWHKCRQIANQDVLRHGKNGNLTAIILADGVSSCKCSEKGAQIAADAASELLLNHSDFFFAADKRIASGYVLEHIRNNLRDFVKRAGNSLDDYSSTLACALYDNSTKRLMCFNLGDGLIIANECGRCRVLAMPADSRNGCCVTTTRSAEYEASISCYDASKMQSVMLCSDGAWNVMYNRSRLIDEVSSIIKRNDYHSLGKYLRRQSRPDDCSFISFTIRKASDKI